MNAPAKIKPTSARDQYIPTVERLMPGAIGKERELRCSLLLMRDNAASAMRRCSDEAYPVLAIVSNMAARYAFEPMATEQIEALRYQLIRLTATASGLETFAQSFVVRIPGKQDASGG